MSNLKQFGLAAAMYMNENNDTLPAVQGPDGFLFFQPNGSLGKYLWPNTIIDSTHPCKLRCPSYQGGGIVPPYGDPMINLNVDICYYNSWGGAYDRNRWTKINDLPSAAGVVLMRDMEGNWGEWTSFYGTGYYAVYAGYLQQFYSTRHQGGFNALFVDGHASFQKDLPNTLETWGRY
ncbi:MAG: hypothetical protein HY360_11905 [Verrucomicrobia bacterium]|nr:hypothetical protein [Verrucomicrobiota bacterium]